ncbi:MAG: hypothetical protein IT446_15895 [Phycisphaerales bacterium]|jgi:hypothetical protein|nr:hypothetical protein [Phycisphaerales bacterium]
MNRPLSLFLAFGMCLLLVNAAQAGEYPKPSPYPISWELNFSHSQPQRIVVKAPGELTASAYWYVTYTVTNNTRQEQLFLPMFELLGDDGAVMRSDDNIPPAVFDAIKARTKNDLLQPPLSVGPEIRIGEDQAIDSVAIWREPKLRMGQFSIFATGLNGEWVYLKDDQGNPVKGADGQPVILRKTLMLTYLVRGDETFGGPDAVVEKSQQWVMR